MLNFNDKLNAYAERGNSRSAYHLLLQKIGKALVEDKESFVELLKESGIDAFMSDSSSVLAEKYTDNIFSNKELMLGSNLLIQTKNISANNPMDDDAVKNGYFMMRDYLAFDEEDYLYLAADPVTAVAQGVGEIAKLGSTAVEGSQKLRYAKKYGAIDSATALAQKREETKQALLNSIVQQKKLDADRIAEEEKRQKKTRNIILISSISVAVLIIGAAVVYKMRRNG